MIQEVTLENITKQIGKTTVLTDICLTMKCGQICGITGENGSGKTMLMRVIAGLVSPSTGKLLFDGKNRADANPNIGIMIENASLYPELSGRENLRLLASIRKQATNEDIDQAIRRVGLEPTDKRTFRKYSLGMKQRLGIAASIVHDPELLILDEPTNGLDPIGIAEMRSFIRELCSTKGKTVLISSHILSEIAMLADDVGIIDRGVLLEEESLKELEKKIGYTFENHKLLERAMMHSSYTNEKHLEKYRCNERLEFLGDAVLELISSEYLFGELPRVSEGELTKTRASMVCEPSLAMCARDIDLGSYLLLGKGEEATGGRMRDSITSDAMEALIGAIYLDGGFTSAKEFIHRFILTDLEDKKLFYDSKTILQEIVQANKAGNITYELVGEEGPDHNKTFEVRVRIGGQPYGSGKGRSKKAAEQKAAYQAIIMYRSMK